MKIKWFAPLLLGSYFLSACSSASSPFTPSQQSSTTSSASLADATDDEQAAATGCHNNRVFIKRAQFARNGGSWTKIAAIRRNFFTKIRVRNRFNVTITVTPKNNPPFTVAPNKPYPDNGDPQVLLATPTKAVTVTLPTGQRAGGPGVQVNNISCRQ